MAVKPVPVGMVTAAIGTPRPRPPKGGGLAGLGGLKPVPGLGDFKKKKAAQTVASYLKGYKA